MPHIIAIVDGVAEFHCTNELTAPCHTYPSCGCEYWSEDHDKDPEHAPVVQQLCYLSGWYADGDQIDEAFMEDELPIPRNFKGEITVEWEGDFYSWHFDEEYEDEL